VSFLRYTNLSFIRANEQISFIASCLFCADSNWNSSLDKCSPSESLRRQTKNRWLQPANQRVRTMRTYFNTTTTVAGTIYWDNLTMMALEVVGLRDSSHPHIAHAVMFTVITKTPKVFVTGTARQKEIGPYYPREDISVPPGTEKSLTFVNWDGFRMRLVISRSRIGKLNARLEEV
jgi:hypothetical protein